MIYDRIKFLANKRKLSLNQVEEQMGYSKNTLYKLKYQKPGTERLEQLADYFNVSTDYLLGREKAEEDQYEQQLVAMFRKQTDGMDDSQKEKFNKSLDKLFSVAEALLNDEDSWEGD
jgi:transcriptional regulator with XRE-family HTH domain